MLKASILLSLLFASLFVFAAEKVELINHSLESWRKPVGAWTTCIGVKVDPQNPRKLLVEMGNGKILVNGAAGPTVNLVSEFLHGDVEAHIEFIVPKNSNSGIYFQGRYEIQVLDS